MKTLFATNIVVNIALLIYHSPHTPCWLLVPEVIGFVALNVFLFRKVSKS